MNPAVIRAARKFGLPPEILQRLVDTEGGPAAFIRSVKVHKGITANTIKTLEQALDVACRRVVAEMFRLHRPAPTPPAEA